MYITEANCFVGRISMAFLDSGALNLGPKAHQCAFEIRLVGDFPFGRKTISQWGFVYLYSPGALMCEVSSFLLEVTDLPTIDDGLYFPYNIRCV